MPYTVLVAADSVAVWTLFFTVDAVLAAVGSIVVTIYYGRRAPTAEDLQGVEKNTAETAERVEKVRLHVASVDERQHKQHKTELLHSKRVSIEVSGEAQIHAALTARFTLKDSEVKLTYVEMYDFADSLYGRADTTQAEPLLFTAVIDGMEVQRWYSGGEPAVTDTSRRRVRLRVYMELDNQETFRDVTAYLSRVDTYEGSMPIRRTPMYGLSGKH